MSRAIHFACVVALLVPLFTSSSRAAEQTDATTSLTALDLAAQAEARMRASEWSQAAKLWQRVVDLNPVVGTYWGKLGRSSYQAKDYPNSIKAYEHALALRDGYPWATAYNIACCHALSGNKQKALEWLNKSFSLGYRSLENARSDKDLESLHEEPEFRKLVALVDVKKLSRTEGWRYDIALLVRELKRLHYLLARGQIPPGFDALASKLTNDVPTSSDHQLEVGLMQLAAIAGDGHTVAKPAYLMRDRRKAVGVEFYQFQEGLFITEAAPQHQDLLGCEVLRVGSHSVAEVRAALDPLISHDNEIWKSFIAPGLLRNPQVLNGLGLIPADDQLPLTLRGHDGKERQATLKVDAGQPASNWIHARAQTPGPEPLYLRKRQVPYWFEHLPGSKTIFMQYNEVRDDPKEPLKRFCARLFDYIDNHEIDKLVIDMRFNGGGNNFLNKPLVEGLMRCDKINQHGKLFVLIGRNTFSAAQCGITQIERHTSAIFAGEPSGSCPNFVGETIMLKLPYSKITASISDLYWQNSVAMDYRTWIAPQIYVPPTFAAYRARKDPALEAVLAYGVEPIREKGKLD